MTDSDTRRLEQKLDAALQTLARLEGFLQPTIDSLKTQIGASTVRHDDHERRLRALERFRFSVPSAAVLSLLVSFAVLVYYVTQGAH